MKKFLFTLAALFMAGTAMADSYLYIDDFEIAQDQIGTELTIPVQAHFDARVSAMEIQIQYPEGLVATFCEAGADCAVSIKNARGRDAVASATLWGAAEPYDHMILTLGDSGYWQDPNGEDPTAWVTYGVAKWEAGDYEEMLLLYVEADETFKGGSIVITTNPSSGKDTRGGTVKENGDENVPFVKETAVTVEGAGPVEPQTLAGQIVFGEPTEDGVITINYTGEEDVTMVVTLNGEVVELTEGTLQLIEGMNVVTVTVSAEGYEPMSATAEFEWTKPEPPAPEVTAAPTITVDENYNLIVEGEGEIHVYVNGEEVTLPYTFEQTDEDVTYVVTATAQAAGKEISEVATFEVTIPAKEVTPEDPHMTGYWLVQINAAGEKIYTELFAGQNGDFINVDDITYPEFRDICAFYFLINGEAYGANEDMTEAFLGDADMNPLTAGENTYFVGVGYSYTFGIHFIYDQNTMEFMGYSAYVAKGGPVDVDEINAGKAVAGVRYFNMAGQEMQEANGMTIVVTTYTDGTTSAVKVMK